MEPEIQSFLSEVDAYLAATRMADSTLGRKAINDHKFIVRLRNGAQSTPRTMNKIRDFMAANPPSSSNGEQPAHQVAAE